MQQPVILGTDFTSMNFIGIIWTHEGMRKMIRSNGSTVIELPDTTSGVPLVLALSIKIQPGGSSIRMHQAADRPDGYQN